MPWLDVIWTDENEAHITANGVSCEEVEHVLRNSIGAGFSRSSGRPFVIGYTPAGERLMVVFEECDAVSVYPITAYFIED